MDLGAYDYADTVQNANDPRCNDHWAIFYSTWQLPSGVWADNAVNQGHILWNDNKLNGYFTCNPNGDCTTCLCTKHGSLANAWTVKVTW